MGECFDDERVRGTPKQPTLTIHNLINGEYIRVQYRNGELMRSLTLPDLQLTLQQIIDMMVDAGAIEFATYLCVGNRAFV